VLLLSDTWKEQTLTWSGNILAGEDVTLSYTLKPLVPKNISITGKLRSNTISVDKVSVLTPKSNGFISINATGGAKTLVGTTHDAIFMLENEIDEEVEVSLLLEVPSGILFTGGNPQYERSVGTTMHYSVKARLPQGEKLTWTAKLRLDEQGSFDVKYKVIASAGSQDETIEGVFPYEIPYLPLTLQVEQISDYFQVGKPIPLAILLRNRDQTATFLDVAISIETQGKTVGLERAKLDGITPDSDVEIVFVNLTFLEQKLQSYKVNVTYRKGSEKLSVAKELQFYPEPTKPTSELSTTKETTQQETILENVPENKSSAILKKNEPVVATVSVQERSPSSIFLIVLVTVAIIGGIAFVALRKKQQEP
jgi:hypothetical protein